MPEHIESEYNGIITWLGTMSDRSVSVRATPIKEADARFEGLAGDSHGGITRESCNRTIGQHPLGTNIRNTRQLSVLCAEELAEISTQMGVQTLNPALIGANVVVSGIRDFSHLPPASRLIAPSGATLVVDVTNLPCNIPAREIDAEHPDKGRLFKSAAKGRRGVSAWVLCEGVLRLGDKLQLHIPAQRAWCGETRS